MMLQKLVLMLQNTDGFPGYNPYNISLLSIYALCFGWYVLESTSSEIKHQGRDSQKVLSKKLS